MLIGPKCFAQIEKPVKWEFAVQKINQKEATLYLKATIQDGWHIYSMDAMSDGPVRTSFKFDRSPQYTLIGKTSQPAAKSKFEKAFNSKVSFFEKEVIFVQRLRLKSATGTVHGRIEYMTCSDKKCLPPDALEFSVIL
jgi:thiol:disulfide interchange protein DsbD